MKRALLIGINYIGTGNDLRGCINDAKNMEALLRDQYGFSDIKLLLEKDATTAGIKAGMKWLIEGVVPGDVIVMHYSGHGSQLPSKTEADGYEEIICPIDLNWRDKVITDQDLRSTFNQVPNGVNTTVILDCCHSGDGMNQFESYYTEAVDYLGTGGSFTIVNTDGQQENRYLAPPEGLCAERDHVVEWHASRDINASALLIAGCRSNQTSADAFISGMPQGAATASILAAVKANPNISYRALLDSMTDFMLRNGFSQRPQLDGSGALYDLPFVQPFGEVAVPEIPVASAPNTEAPNTPAPRKKIDPAIGVAIGFIVLLLLFLTSH